MTSYFLLRTYAFINMHFCIVRLHNLKIFLNTFLPNSLLLDTDTFLYQSITDDSTSCVAFKSIFLQLIVWEYTSLFAAEITQSNGFPQRCPQLYSVARTFKYDFQLILNTNFQIRLEKLPNWNTSSERQNWFHTRKGLCLYNGQSIRQMTALCITRQWHNTIGWVQNFQLRPQKISVFSSQWEAQLKQILCSQPEAYACKDKPFPFPFRRMHFVMVDPYHHNLVVLSTTSQSAQILRFLCARSLSTVCKQLFWDSSLETE